MNKPSIINNSKQAFLTRNINYVFNNAKYTTKHEQFFVRPTHENAMLFFNHMINEVEEAQNGKNRTVAQVLSIINSYLERISHIHLFYTELLSPNRSTLMAMELILLRVSALKADKESSQPSVVFAETQCMIINEKKVELEEMKNYINEYCIEYQKHNDKIEKNEVELLESKKKAVALDEEIQEALALEKQLNEDNEYSVRQFVELNNKFEQTSQELEKNAELEQLLSDFDNKQTESESLDNFVEQLEKLDIPHLPQCDESMISKLDEIKNEMNELSTAFQSLTDTQNLKASLKEEINIMRKRVAELQAHIIELENENENADKLKAASLEDVQNLCKDVHDKNITLEDYTKKIVQTVEHTKELEKLYLDIVAQAKEYPEKVLSSILSD